MTDDKKDKEHGHGSEDEESKPKDAGKHSQGYSDPANDPSIGQDEGPGGGAQTGPGKDG